MRATLEIVIVGGSAATDAAMRVNAATISLADVAAAKRVVERCRPVIIMIEETAGLHSHHSELYFELQEELSGWPYEWRHGLVDCADLGAAHHRRRVLWVGVRKVEAAEA